MSSPASSSSAQARPQGRGKAAKHWQRGLALYDKHLFHRALHAWRRAGELGHAEAQYRLGLLYARGEGVLQSLPDAVAWYQRAAEQGQAEAQFQLGLIHLNGVKAASGPYSPENWLRAATHRDRTATQETFDLLFPNGVEVTADAEAAIAGSAGWQNPERRRARRSSPIC